MSIRNKLIENSERGEKSVGLFLTCGFPDPAASDQILDALADSGVDFVELGMPFSDPLAEGLPIQRSSQAALRHGIRLSDVLESAQRFRAKHETPLVLMGYANPIHRYGVERFCDDAARAGVDGLILADLSLEASDMVDNAARSAGLELIYLVAPSTPLDRVSEIDARTTGFVYAVALSGLTGDALDDLAAIQDYLSLLRSRVVSNPLMVGFGIDRHDLGMRLSEHTDGFIVGSALVREIERVWEQPGFSEIDRLNAIARFAEMLKSGLPQN